MSYVVAGRTREVGVRVALGASRSNVLFLIMRQGMSLALIGLVVGLIVSFAVAQLLVKVLFGVSPADPLTFAGVTLLLALVAALACYVPARRAMKVDPGLEALQIRVMSVRYRLLACSSERDRLARLEACVSNMRILWHDLRFGARALREEACLHATLRLARWRSALGKCRPFQCVFNAFVP